MSWLDDIDDFDDDFEDFDESSICICFNFKVNWLCMKC